MTHLLVTNDFPPKVGGIQSYLWELWRRLPADSFAVLTTAYDGGRAFDAQQPFRVVRADGMAAAEGGDARVAGGGVELLEVWCLGELPGERVLASARPDQEHLHTRTLATTLGGLESGYDRAR